LITDGEHPTKTNPAEVDSLVQKFNERGIRLNVITLDFANELGQDESDEEVQAKPAGTESRTQTENKTLLVDISERLDQAAIFPAQVAMEIYKQFNKREY
jgi:hypothetical protein